MKISSYIITMILVGAVVVGIYNFQSDLISERAYNVEVDDSYKVTYDKLNDLSENVNETQNRVRAISAKEDKNFFTGTWDVFVMSKEIVFGAGDLAGDSISVGYSLITNLVTDMGIGSTGGYVILVLISILTVLFISALIFLIIKRVY